MTHEQAHAAIKDFETTTLPPMCAAWDALRVKAVEAMRWLDSQKDGLK